jgi:serine/threonine-protein kinase RsbW
MRRLERRVPFAVGFADDSPSPGEWSEGSGVISLTVPGALQYRDVAVRVVGAACKLFSRGASDSTPPGLSASNDLADEMVSQVVSAFSEAFNNLALHGYKGVTPGNIEIRVDLVTDSEGNAIVVEIKDTGRVFDPAQHMDLPEELPERGMGLFIIRSFMDDVAYRGGPPNVLTLKKKIRR